MQQDATLSMQARLGLLTPGEPAGYFLLGEEAADSEGGSAQARVLFGLAFELARTSGDDALAGAAAWALGSLSEPDRDAHFLKGVAMVLDPRYAGVTWMDANERHQDRSKHAQAAEAIAAAWLGRGHIVRERLRDDAVRRLIDESPELRPAGSPREPSDWLLAVSRDWPCPECRNNGWVTNNTGGQVRRELCPNCHGDPGPALSPAQLGSLLRAQARLLSGSAGPGAMPDASGAPARDPNTASVAPMLGIDARRCVWRDGAWVVPGG